MWKPSRGGRVAQEAPWSAARELDKPEPLILTVREAATLMHIGRDTAYALVAEGRIPSVRLGRHIRIPRKA